MDTRLIAIDPGASGGIALWDGASAAAWAMPETEAEIAHDFIQLVSSSAAAQITAYVEKVGGYVAGNRTPGSAMFNFGRNYGFILGALAALGVRTVLVTPQQWQKALGLGHRGKDTDKAAWKRKLKAEAGRLYPGLAPTLKTADALLILEYARRDAR